MADVSRVISFLFLCSVYVATSGMLDGKAFYCRDPDTGKLHSINSTWPSVSFCGNYSCKLKKQNITETKYTPIRQYNVSVVNLDNNKNDINAGSVEVVTPVSIEKKMQSDIQPILHLNTELKTPENINSNNDRYLTESEIQSISEILHTIKKSDLDAIVDIYNLAQDIYKEIDNQTLNNKTESHDNVEAEKNEVNVAKLLPNTKPTSYWYEPLNVNMQKAERPGDMEHQGSNMIPIAIAYNRDPKQLYYTGTPPIHDFGKLPYFYPISNFQRMSSYVHQSPSSSPCSRMNEHELINKVLKRPEQKLIQPSVLLPYPFSYVHNFNTSYLNNHYYNPNTWSYYDFYNHRNYQPYSYISSLPSNTVYTNPQTNFRAVERNSVSKEENDILDDLIAKAKKAKLPDWQTAPLPDHVLDEVRANIQKSTLLNPFSFRKKVNLEKVGKLIKLDEFSRSKRDTRSKFEKQTSKEDEGLYETFLEAITCPPDTQLGYFRRGNLSKPYPECCPQRIDKTFASVYQEQISNN